jgi:hypothetical protein
MQNERIKGNEPTNEQNKFGASTIGGNSVLNQDLTQGANETTLA